LVYIFLAGARECQTAGGTNAKVLHPRGGVTDGGCAKYGACLRKPARQPTRAEFDAASERLDPVSEHYVLDEVA